MKVQITKTNCVGFHKLKKLWKRVEQSEVVDIETLQAITCVKHLIKSGQLN